MTDRYQPLRDAIAAGPTPGPWEADHESCSDFSLIGPTGVYIISGCGCCGSPNLDSGSGDADAAYIAAADPDTIAALLRERDALRAECERLRADARRYRWLRDVAATTTDSEPVVCSSTPNDRECLFGDGLDAAIDKAMEASNDN